MTEKIDNELTQEISADENVEPKKRTRLKKGDNFYVNNAELLTAISLYREEWMKYVDSEMTIERPSISNELGGMIKKIAERTVYHPKYIKFPSIREEMVSDAITNCCKYCHNFNHLAETRSGKPNPFGYITQICTNSFIQRISSEKHQFLTKAKYVQSSQMRDQIDEIFSDTDGGSDGEAIASMIRMFYNVELPEHNELVDHYGNGIPETFINDGILWLYDIKQGKFFEHVEPDPVGVEVFF